jgi:predicted O-methyltransferase YrrM
MLQLNQPPSTDPSIILRYRDRQYAADLVAAALLEFEFFDFLKANASVTSAEIGTHFDWKPRPTDVLLTLCRASGFVVTDDAGRCQLTTTGHEYLTSDSPWFLGPYYKPIADSPILRNFVTVLKTGKPANWQSKSDGADWHESMKDPSFASDFTNLMNCRGIAFGQKLAEALSDEMVDRTTMLDVGGGSGIYSSVMAARFPDLKATVLEQSPVDTIAENEIDRLGLATRVNVMSGDMFEDTWPENMDVVLLSNLLHDWDIAEATSLVQRAVESLADGGILVIHGAIINADKTGPLPVAEYSALLMNITQGKCYSVTEYAEMVQPFGLKLIRHSETIGDRGFVMFR